MNKHLGILKILGGLVGLLSAAPASADASWTRLDNHLCHTYLAFPYANSCDWVTGRGHPVERNCGIDCWQTDPRSNPDEGGLGLSIAVSKNGNPWMVSDDGSLSVRSGAWSTGVWTKKPLNACGTGATIPFDTDNYFQVLAVGIDGSNRDVPWVIDATDTVRFWRTRFKPACWAAVPQVPGQGRPTSIGVYDDPNVAQDNLPWVSKGGNLYLFNGSRWELIDGNTGTVGSNSAYVSAADGLSLWKYQFDGGTFIVEPSWDMGEILWISSDAAGHVLVLNSAQQVWLHAGPL